MIELESLSLVDLGIMIALALTTLGGIAGCIRLMLGPSLADRVVSLDLVTILLIAIAGLIALKTGEAVYLDLGLALALVGFLATVAFARYAERRPERRDDRSEFTPKATIAPAQEAENQP